LALSVLPIALFGGEEDGTVLTFAGRLEGTVRIQEKQLVVAGKPVPWAQTIMALMNSDRRTFRSPNVVWLKTGEVWHGETVGFSGGTLKFRSSILGKHEIELEQIHRLDFTPIARLPRGAEKGTLYRLKEEAAPGSLLWIDKKEISINSPFGVVTIPRDTASLYILGPPPAPAAPKGAEVGLIDGSFLHGNAKMGSNKVTLEHSILGKLALPVQVLRSLRPLNSSVIFLSDLKPHQIRGTPVFARDVPADWYFHRLTAPLQIGKSRSRSAIRFSPKITVQYRLPDSTKGRKVNLSGIIGAVSDARGDTKLTLKAAGKVIYETTVTASSEARSFSVPIPTGNELIIEVAFGSRPLFPCGVLLGDAVLVIK
jgi:hypothetical protein